MPHQNPLTKIQLQHDLRELGIKPGMILLIHSSLKSIGWVIGGPITVIQALIEVVSPAGTLIMPTHSSDYSDPEPWQHPPAPPDSWPIIREHMPAFDPAITPSRHMGIIPEVFRTFPSTKRSSHPTVSFCALGKHADQIISNHSLSYSLGEESPLAKIYVLDGHVLLLGVDYDKNTSFHLAEYRLPEQNIIQCGSPIFEDGKRVWKAYQDIAVNDKPFLSLGKDFESNNAIKIGPIGQAKSRLFSQRLAVDYAKQWLKNNSESIDSVR
jgi:aminoglycoside 3-N-acetyltransferase